MPVYNGGRFIRQAVASLLAQTYQDFELVIADNASTDATEAICREFVAQDQRVRYVRNERNLGGPGNFRRVFSLCSGEYHKWATADDYWAPTVLEESVAILDRHPDVVVCYPKTRLVNEAGSPVEDFEDSLHLQEPSPATRMIRVLTEITLCHVHLGLIRRAALGRTALIGDELASDVRFIAELSLYGKFYVLPEFLFFRRFHEGCSSWERADMERQRAYYDPEHRKRFGLHLWRRYVGLLSAVTRAPIGMKERLILYRYLGRKMRWQRWVLLRELGAILRP